MKKYAMMLCALILILSVVSASAATITENTSQQTQTVLTATTQNSYVITIPETISFHDKTATIPITMQSNAMEPWKCIVLTASSPNYKNNTWRMLNAQDSNYYLSYDLTRWNGYKLAPNQLIYYLWPPDDGDNVSFNLFANITGDTSVAGTWTDVITWTVNVQWICRECASPTTPSLYCIACGRCEDCVYICEEHHFCSECEQYKCVNGIHCLEECTCDARCAECGSTKATYTVQCAYCGLCEDCVYVCTDCTNWHCPSHNVCSCGKCLESGECDD